MWKYNKKYLITLCLVLLAQGNFIFAQSCNFNLKGIIYDSETKESIAFANICNETTLECYAANASGFFQFNYNYCNEVLDLVVSAIGYQTKHIDISLKKDTLINFYLEPTSFQIEDVVVHREHNEDETSTQLNQKEILQHAEKNFAEVLTSLPGVQILKTGSGNSKPIIQGLSANRIRIINQGIEQSGQQWGNDHSPEIDPYSAQEIKLEKGANSLQYSVNALGGTIVINPKPIYSSSKLKGAVNYVFQSNGLGNTLNFKLEKYHKKLSFRVNGTLKKIGDRHTPHYYLKNTGKQEGNISILLEKKWNARLKTSLLYSYYTTTIGILRGSHIGNLTDLEEAIGREEPFYTSSKFSYHIQSPKQNVQHHLAKLEAKHLLSDKDYMVYKYGFQFNDRKEFDVRRNGRSNIPALSLQKQNHQVQIAYHRKLSTKMQLHSGIQYTFTNNTNNPETGILPLIPDYLAHEAAAYSILKTHFNKLSWNVALRYQYKHLYALAISRSLPRKIIKTRHNFHTYGIATDLQYAFSKKYKIGLEAKYLSRAPEINELYSFGLHQGISSIEEGDKNLKPENAFKLAVNHSFHFGKKLRFENETYFQHIQGFIYLKPEKEFRITIRGAFPVFTYKQTNAILIGNDFALNYTPINPLEIQVKYALIRSRDLQTKTTLINMPSDQLSAKLSYLFKSIKQYKRPLIFLKGAYTFKQNQLKPDQDFMPAPKGYFLLDFGYSSTIDFQKFDLGISFSVENLLNTQYREYTNRQRYFADGLRANARLGISFTF